MENKTAMKKFFFLTETLVTVLKGNKHATDTLTLGHVSGPFTQPIFFTPDNYASGKPLPNFHSLSQGLMPAHASENYMSMFLSVYLSVWLPVCLCPSACLPACLSACPPVCLSSCVHVCPSITAKSLTKLNKILRVCTWYTEDGLSHKEKGDATTLEGGGGKFNFSIKKKPLKIGHLIESSKGILL